MPEKEVPKRLRRSDVLRPPSTLSRFFLGLAETEGAGASPVDFASSTDPGDDNTAEVAVTAERGGVCGTLASLEWRLAASLRDALSFAELESLRQNRRRLLDFVSDETVSPCIIVSVLDRPQR